MVSDVVKVYTLPWSSLENRPCTTKHVATQLYNCEFISTVTIPNE